MATPFLKWAGGKSKLLPTLLDLLPPGERRYHEPFLGGGAIFFGLRDAGRINHPVLNDLNEELTETYRVVRDDPGALIRELDALASEYLASPEREARAAIFYRIRAEAPATPHSRAARFIFLNRTCFNGLYRVNQRGQFNVPHGDYANPRIVDRAGIYACSAALSGAELTSVDFEAACDRARPGDLIYFDPPYQPLSRTASFTAYTSADFDEAAQRRLAAVAERLSNDGVAVVLSNSAHPFVEDLYRMFRVSRLPMGRAINSNGERRGPIDELIVTNFGYLNGSPK